MANYRIPGSICGSRQPWPLEDGTLARSIMPCAGPVCASSWLYESLDLTTAAPPTTDPDVGFIFVQCLNPARGLTDADYADAAKSLDIEVAMIKAVAEVESPRGPFDGMGRPEILYERHYFHRLTGGKYDKEQPDISNSSSGGYGKYSAQYGKLQRAFALDRDAALRSASWGRFQIMGENFKAAGFDSAAAFVLALTKSEAEHLKAFVSFVKSNKAMADALRKKDWAGFASRYNGPGYKKNDYDTKLEEAYTRHSAAGTVP